jgi:mannose-6-phosphate isomerase
MAASDNVLRGGLTPKHVDLGELMNILHFVPFIPQIITPPSSAMWFCYHTPCNDFLLSMMRGTGEEKAFPQKGPAVCIVTEGELRTGKKKNKKGESFYLPQTDFTCLFSGEYSLFAASSAEK